MNQRPTKVVFPVAGLGTRFLPATKAVAKELLPVADRPLIQWAVEEAAEAGFEHFIFVTSPHKSAVAAHFDPAPHLQENLSARDNQAALELLKAGLPDGAKIDEVEQAEPLGLGHAIWCARELVGDEPFAVILVDDLVHHETGCLQQMLQAYRGTGGNMVAVETVPPEDTQKYGIIAPGRQNGAVIDVTDLVEKPSPETAPSQLAIIGRYILQPEIFATLSAFKKGAGNEIQITDAIADLMGDVSVYGFAFQGTRFDCGMPDGLLAANVAYGLSKDREKTAELRRKLHLILENFG